ncbi:hypothetical protein X737_12910 [Mesorhizobium sp. L48C026A00]|nr:hypothetical protein X737_12910 [Mesorhizobium sp. L48C026A00]
MIDIGHGDGACLHRLIVQPGFCYPDDGPFDMVSSAAVVHVFASFTFAMGEKFEKAS